MEINLVQDSTFRIKMTELIEAIEGLKKIGHPHYAEGVGYAVTEGSVSYDIE